MERLIAITRLFKKEKLTDTRLSPERIQFAHPSEVFDILNHPAFRELPDAKKTISQSLFAPLFRSFTEITPLYEDGVRRFGLKLTWGNRTTYVSDEYDWDPLIGHNLIPITRPTAYMLMGIDKQSNKSFVNWGFVNFRDLIKSDKEFRIKRGSDNWYLKMQKEIQKALESGLSRP